MGHSSTTNYTISQSITTEQNGDSVIAGTLPNQAGNGSVILTITPNLGFTVNASDFTIGGVAADSTSNLTSTLTNFSTGNLLSSVQYNFIGSSSGGNSVSLPSEVKNVVMFNSEYNYDATANSYLPVTANNVVYVHVFFMDTFQMPAQDTTLNIDIDGSASADNLIQYPAVWETWTGPTNSDYTISVTGNPLLTGMNLSQSTNSNTALNNISGLVDDGVQTLLMTKVFTAATGKYFTDITEQEQFSAFGLADWLPYFETQITNQVFNTNGEETSRTIEFYYTNPPVSSSLDPTFGGNNYGLGFLFEYIIGTQATVYPLAGGGTGGISPLAPKRPFGGLVNTTSSSELGGSVEDVNPAVTTIPDTEFFGKVTNIVLDTNREINAKGGETRSLTLYGTAGATYSVSISNGSNTYDDSSDTFTSGATTIDSEIGSEGSTTHEIVFPAVTSTTTYTFTLSSRFGTTLPANITDGVSGNIGSIISNATKTFTLAFASAGDISASMPSDLVFSFAELNNETASNTFKVEITGDAGEEFSSVDAIIDAPDATAAAAMTVTSGSESGWEWAMSGFSVTHGSVDSKTNQDRMTIGGTITVQTLGSSNVKYTLALDSITNVS
tara:strand:- start:8243 stop:10078 length:1836 start_codon:yes stop_codon:yes gene_type:complete